MHATLTGSCDCHMTRRKMICRSRFHVCVHGIVLLATLRDASKKQAEERALDVEEAAEKGSSVENGLSAVATYLQVDGFVPYYPVELILNVRKVTTGSHHLRFANRPRARMHVHTPSCDEGCAHQHSILIHF